MELYTAIKGIYYCCTKNMNVSQNNYAKWEKLDQKKYMLCFFMEF